MLYLTQYLMPQRPRLVQKCLSKIFFLQSIQLLQIILGLNRPHKGKAIPVPKEVFHHPPNTIFSLNQVRGTFLYLQCLFEIFFCLDGYVVLVDQMQSKVSDQPQKAREVLLNVFVFRVLRLNVICQVSEHTDVIEGVLVNTAD